MMTVRLFDDRKHEVAFSSPPRRIVSLVPSDSYSIAQLGCAEALVGRTDYCELPETIASVPRIGGTKSVRVADVIALEPDLVIANQEENTHKAVQELSFEGIRVFVGFPKRVAESVAWIARLARVLGVERSAGARQIVRSGYEEFARGETERAAASPRTRLRVFCPIWMDPLMTIHESTFLSDMIAFAGGENVFATRTRLYPLAADQGRAEPWSQAHVGERDVRYPRITLDEVVAKAPDVVLLPDEPHAFTETDADVFRKLPIPAARTGNILRVSGKDLCWHGVWTVGAMARVRRILEDARARAAS